MAAGRDGAAAQGGSRPVSSGSLPIDRSSPLGHRRTTRHVRGGGSFPRKRLIRVFPRRWRPISSEPVEGRNKPPGPAGACHRAGPPGPAFGRPDGRLRPDPVGRPDDKLRALRRTGAKAV